MIKDRQVCQTSHKIVEENGKTSKKDLVFQNFVLPKWNCWFLVKIVRYFNR